MSNFERDYLVSKAWSWLSSQKNITTHSIELGDCYKAASVLYALNIAANNTEYENRVLELERNLKAATALLEELGEYMDKRADTVDGENPRPNTEMCFSQEIYALLEKIK